MDIPRPDQARRKRRRRILLTLAGVLGVGIVTAALSRLEPAAPTVEKATVLVDTVKRGPMLREVRGNGTLVPEEIRWVTAASAGRIDRIPLLPGVVVESNTVLLELSSPELIQAAADTHSRLQTAEADLEKLKVQLESDELQQESVLASLQSDSEQAKLEAEADDQLAKDGLVPSLSARRSRARASDLEARVKLEEKRLAIRARSATAALRSAEVELANLRKQYELKLAQVAALKVRAGVNGVLQKLGELQVGQQVAAGAYLAQIADPTRLKAEIKVAETQAKDIQFGQVAAIDTHNGVIPGHVVRIDPAVQNGTVTVDVALDGPLPKGARPDLSVDGKVTLEKLDDVVYVGCPANAQPEAKVSLFKLVDGGKAALRVPVQLGRSSVHTVEIREGLTVGDQVIVSEMSQWDTHDRIRLN
ncbi:MAG: HlyD family efflux transporter periplasmic adaptor subunit [Verrucomicrobia bacterium]|nr:HlyD family efflux transporter periplasmic adaptor subunit [Verrucomicrobiota bacterium]